MTLCMVANGLKAVHFMRVHTSILLVTLLIPHDLPLASATKLVAVDTASAAAVDAVAFVVAGAHVDVVEVDALAAAAAAAVACCPTLGFP